MTEMWRNRHARSAAYNLYANCRNTLRSVLPPMTDGARLACGLIVLLLLVLGSFLLGRPESVCFPSAVGQECYDRTDNTTTHS